MNAIFDLVGRADSWDGISTAVVEETRAQTKRTDGILLHSGFEPQHLSSLEGLSETAADGAARLAYVGTIISENAFIQMLAALDKIRQTLPQKVVLEFFGGRGYRTRSWFNPEWMVEHGIFSDSQLVEALRRCSWGIVVMDPEGEDLRYSRFSFPNKIGTYLSAGVPVLGLGHPSSSLAEVMKRHRVGLFTSALDKAALERFLAEALQVPEPRSWFHKDILQCARTEFNAGEIRVRLWKAWGV
jgi:hypothetical protein